MNIKTILHTYEFDTKTAAGRDGWQALKEKLKAWPHCHGPVLSDCYGYVAALDGKAITLETKHLFNNQWNTAPIPGISETGLRIFDWALQSDSAPHSNLSAPRGIRRGHYLEQTPEMRELRRNTMACGYCGKQEPAAKGYVFCPHCLDSEYLTAANLYLTRMISVEDTDKPRAPLTKAERGHLLPLYREAQTHGSTERGKARMAKRRADIEKDFVQTTAQARIKRDGHIWLLDRGITADPIFYNHTGRFGFGWREPVDAELLSALLDIISEFPFPYDIKCADGRTLSGG